MNGRAKETPEGMRILLLAGATGARLDSFADIAYNTVRCGCGLRAYKEKFESVLEEEFGGESIEKIAYKATIGSRELITGRFIRALESIIDKAKKNNVDVLVLSAHLSYTTANTIVINPIVHEISYRGSEVDIIYIVEDYYDSLRRIAERIRRHNSILEKPLTLDPLLYLSWRGFEHNLLSSLQHTRGNLKITLFGAKHPVETFRKLVKNLACNMHYTRAYYSHPIRTPRQLRGILGGVPLHRVPLVIELERVKALLRRMDVILYEPTTIDELIKEDACLVFEYLYRNYERRIVKIVGSKDTGSLCDSLKDERIDILSPIVSGDNRWPIPRDTVNRDYPYVRGGYVDIIDITDNTGSPGFGTHLIRDLVSEISRVRDKLADSYVLRRLETMIQGQIEQRDYTYVEQSQVIVAVSPLYYTVVGHVDEPSVSAWLEVSSGMEAEIRRADALGKRIIMVVLPVGLRYLARGSCANGGDGCIGGAYNRLLNLFKEFKAIVRFKKRVSEKSLVDALIEWESTSIFEHSDNEAEKLRIIIDDMTYDIYKIVESYGSAPLVLFSSVSTLVLPWSKDDLESAFRSLFA